MESYILITIIILSNIFMDQVYHFQTQKGRVGNLKTVISADQKLQQFYSEEEYDSS